MYVFISFNLDYKYTHFFGKLYTRTKSNNLLRLLHITISNIHFDLYYFYFVHSDNILWETSNINGVPNTILNRVHESSKDLLGDREVKIITLAASLKQWFIRLKHDGEGEKEDKMYQVEEDIQTGQETHWYTTRHTVIMQQERTTTKKFQLEHNTIKQKQHQQIRWEEGRI